MWNFLETRACITGRSPALLRGWQGVYVQLEQRDRRQPRRHRDFGTCSGPDPLLPSSNHDINCRSRLHPASEPRCSFHVYAMTALHKSWSVVHVGMLHNAGATFYHPLRAVVDPQKIAQPP